MIHIIYMAAGNSRRFGGNKLLHVWHGKKLYRHTLDMLIDMKKRLDDILSLTVVTQYEEIISDLQDKKEEIDADIVFCNESRLGASYTIKTGINNIKNRCKKGDHIMFVVADQPYLSETTINKLIEATEVINNKNKDGSRNYKVFSVMCKETVGNPCMFDVELIPELLQLEGDNGGRKVAKKHECFYIKINDERELHDIDTAYDLKIQE